MEEEATPPPDLGGPPGGESPDRERGPQEDSVEDVRPSMDRAEILRALEIVERDSAAIAESFVSLFSTLRAALSEVSDSLMQLFNLCSFFIF